MEPQLLLVAISFDVSCLLPAANCRFDVHLHTPAPYLPPALPTAAPWRPLPTTHVCSVGDVCLTCLPAPAPLLPLPPLLYKHSLPPISTNTLYYPTRVLPIHVAGEHQGSCPGLPHAQCASLTSRLSSYAFPFPFLQLEITNGTAHHMPAIKLQLVHLTSYDSMGIVSSACIIVAVMTDGVCCSQ